MTPDESMLIHGPGERPRDSQCLSRSICCQHSHAGAVLLLSCSTSQTQSPWNTGAD